MRRLLIVAIVVAGCSQPGSPGAPPPEPPPPPPPGTAPKETPPRPPDSKLTPGGDSPQAARSIAVDEKKPARWSTQLRPEPQYFAFSSKAGYAIALKGSSTVSFAHRLIDANGKEVASATEVWRLDAAQRFVLKMWGGKDDPGVVDYELKLADCTDAASKGDAPADFDKAVDAPDTFEGWLSTPADGSDLADVFLIAVKTDRPVRVKVTPPAKMRVEVSVYTQERKRMARKRGDAEGAAVEVEFSARYDGKAILGIDAEGSAGGKYAVVVER